MRDVSTLFHLISPTAMSLSLILASGSLAQRRRFRRPVSKRSSHNDSLYSLYGTFEDFSQASVVELLSVESPTSSISSTPKPLLPWRTSTLPSMPESFAETYELIKTFPHISMAPVHLVKHRQLGKQLIIKQLQSRYHAEGQQWPEEAYLLTKVLGTHKNIMGIEAIHTAGDGVHVPYANVVMEYASSGDLYDTIDRCIERDEEVPVEFILHFVSSMIDALAFIHHGHASYDSKSGLPVVVDQPVILHCDIKPDNIFLNLDRDSAYGLPDIKLADFGLAGYEGLQGIRGTKSYFAPELLEADAACREDPEYWKEAQRTSFCSKQSDMYSFAATLYELITLERYRPGDDIETAFYTSHVIDHPDILLILQSGLAYWATDRDLAHSWHDVSFAFKQKLQLWYDAGGRVASWLASTEIPVDAQPVHTKPMQIESKKSAPPKSSGVIKTVVRKDAAQRESTFSWSRLEELGF